MQIPFTAIFLILNFAGAVHGQGQQNFSLIVLTKSVEIQHDTLTELHLKIVGTYINISGLKWLIYDHLRRRDG